MIILKWENATHIDGAFGGLLKKSATYRLKDGKSITCLFEKFTPKKSEFTYGKAEQYFGIEGDNDLDLDAEAELIAHLEALDDAIPIVYLNVNGQTTMIPHITPEILSQLQALIDATRASPFTIAH